MKKLFTLMSILIISLSICGQVSDNGSVVECKLEGQDCHSGQFYIGKFSLGTYEISCNVDGYDANHCGWKIIIGKNWGEVKIQFLEVFNNIGGRFFAEKEGVGTFHLWWLSEYKTINKLWYPRIKVEYQNGAVAWQNSLTFSTTSTELISNIYSRGTRIGIGTTTPSAKLDVAGTIRATEIKVEAQTADFVFDENYSLRSLGEVEEFIKTRGHLPSIPSAENMEKNGVNLAEMTKLLLQKIEELTLYTIEQDEKLKRKNDQVSHLANEIEKMKSDLVTIKTMLLNDSKIPQ
jgi:hypothetical protein